MLQAKAGSPIALKENYNGHGYEYATTPRIWDKARKDAEQVGGYLACIASLAENEFIIQFIRKATNEEVPFTWIGLHDDKAEGDWKWVNGEPTSFTCWFQGEPSNHFGGENKGLIEKRENVIKWNDGSGDRRLYYVIEYDHEIDLDETAGKGVSNSNLRSTR
jgi:hypothetical protein